MSRMMFVNLPVRDLAKTTEFFTSLGFSFNSDFADENTVCLVISDENVAMLHLTPAFEGFAQSPATDTAASREVLIGLSAESRAEVDEKVAAAGTAGGEIVGDAVDQGAMYMRAFRDLDGHQWSLIYLDPAAFEGPE